MTNGPCWTTREMVFITTSVAAAVSFVWGISQALSKTDTEILQAITTLTVTQRDNVDRVKKLETDVQALKLQDVRREALERSIHTIESQQREILDHLLNYEDDFKKRSLPLGKKSLLPGGWQPENPKDHHVHHRRQVR